MVMVGVRVLLGNKPPDRIPSYIEVFGRRTPCSMVGNTPRWFDIPFTRDESLQSEKTLKLLCKWNRKLLCCRLAPCDAYSVSMVTPLHMQKSLFRYFVFASFLHGVLLYSIICVHTYVVIRIQLCTGMFEVWDFCLNCCLLL